MNNFWLFRSAVLLNRIAVRFRRSILTWRSVYILFRQQNQSGALKSTVPEGGNDFRSCFPWFGMRIFVCRTGNGISSWYLYEYSVVKVLLVRINNTVIPPQVYRSLVCITVLHEVISLDHLINLQLSTNMSAEHGRIAVGPVFSALT